MEALRNDLLLRAARGEKVERRPVWLMRQAGRILPDYRRVRASLSGFIELVKNPDLAAEVTIQPVDILGVDAAIIFSDILVIPEAMGLPYEMVEKKGPYFPKTIQNEKDIEQLNDRYEESELGYVMDAIRVTKRDLAGRVPLIGFAGAPWTIFCYMIEGQGSKTFSKARKMLITQPTLSHQLLAKITKITAGYLKEQIAAGANLVQIFDSWAGILSPDLYRSFALPYIDQLCQAIDAVPKTVFAKGAWFVRKELGQLNCEVIGLDWNMDPVESRQMIGQNKCLQGNMDPAVLYGSFDRIREESIRMIQSFGPDKHIANLGHGVYPDIDPEKVKCFIETIKEKG